MKDDDGLLVPDRRVVSIDEAKQERERPAAGAPGSPTAFVTKKEMLVLVGRINDGITRASLAVGQKVFDQVAEETTEQLERMHHQIVQEMRAEFDRRTLRGRWRALLERLGLRRPSGRPALVVDAVEVLDPNVQRAAALAELETLAAEAAVPRLPEP